MTNNSISSEKPIPLRYSKDSIFKYKCPLAGEWHTIHSEEVRVLRVSDGGFLLCCDCGPEDLADVEEKPHPTVDNQVNIYANDRPPIEWLELDQVSDGWYCTSPFEPHPKRRSTVGQFWAELRERAKKLSKKERKRKEKRPSDQTHEEKNAMKVECPYCGASAGVKCQRPSGHSVRFVHKDRKDAAIEAGYLDSKQPTDHETENATLGEFAATP